MTTTVEIHQWVEQGQQLLDDARQTLQSASSEDMKGLAPRVPVGLTSDERPLRVAFAGQYSAGKSSILKAMTGRTDIAIGAGITTQETHIYDWNGIEVVDTPGVHTELRPDHDDAAYNAIGNADLLVFVVSNELFDSHLAEHFRRLAIERDKGHEMLLVVNKMRRAEGGNTKGVQDVIREDLRKVLAPFTPEQLRISFIDAEATLEAREEQDTEVAAILARKSGFDGFLDNLNAFVREKGLTGRYTTALYELEQVLQEALCQESSGDSEIDALEELLVQRRRVLAEAQTRLPRELDAAVQRTVGQVRSEGRVAADALRGGVDGEEVDSTIKAAQDRVQDHANELIGNVEGIIEEQMEELADQISQIAESELARELFARLKARLERELGGLDLSPENLKKLKGASKVTRELGTFLIKQSFNPKATTFAGLFKLNQYSGTAAHTAIKAVGKFFGKSFKPWEAVKWTRAVANAGRVFAVAGAALSFILQVKEDVDAAKYEKDLREGRSAIRMGFGEAAHALEMHFDESTRSFVADTVGQQRKDLDAQLADLRSMQETQTTLFQDLNALLERTRELICEMHEHAVR